MSGNLHYRRCWDCAEVSLHTDSSTPEVLCHVCGSQDTRRTWVTHEAVLSIRLAHVVRHLNDLMAVGSLNEEQQKVVTRMHCRLDGLINDIRRVETPAPNPYEPKPESLDP